MSPGPRVWRGATLGVIAVLGALYLYSSLSKIVAPAPNWAGAPALVALLAAFSLVSAVVAGAVIVLLRGMRALAARRAAGSGVGRLAGWLNGNLAGLPLYLFTLAIPAALTFLLERDGVPRRMAIAVLMVTVAAASAAGAGLWVLGEKPRPSGLRRRFAMGGLALGMVGLTVLGAWLGWAGPAPARATAGGPPVASGASSAAPTTLQDPTAPGSYRTRILTYGSGADRHRPEFAARADLRTTSVDGRPFLRGWSGISGWARTRYWGFDASALPLQGRVYLPEGEGPFPLVLCVHGNHLAEEPSDLGYAYLGELLASRGYVFVSVDESFLNESLADVTSGHTEALAGENAARAWLLLRHLTVFREWIRTPGNVFQNKVDLQRVALVGHSRGGEAVLVAAVLNELPTHPDDPAIPFDFHFGIRAVVAIAPVDGSYEPGGKSASLAAASYLTLQGSLDADVGSFLGARAFERARTNAGTDTFKAAVYLDRASHAQFNTVWGRPDLGGLAGRFVATSSLLPEEDQQQLTRAYVSAFLEATLRGKKAHRALFRDDRTAAPWLPDIPSWHLYQDSTLRRVATFDEDADLTTTTLPGGSLSAHALSDWHEADIPMKAGPLPTRAAWLTWNDRPRPDDPEPPSFTVRLPEGFAPPPRAALSFHLAATKDSTSDPVDLTIELTDRSSKLARLPLSRAGLLRKPPLRSVWKPPVRSDNRTPDTVLQYFDLPLSAFTEATPGFDPTHLTSIRLVFDRTPTGAILLDDMAFREDPPSD